MKKFIINAYKCWGCKTCEATCARVHSKGNKKGISRIVVVAKNKDERVPITCLQCEHAACVLSCKFGALIRNETTCAIERDGRKCTRCHVCVSACPFGNVLLDGKTCEVFKCDLCLGSPECAKTCPSGTLIYK